MTGQSGTLRSVDLSEGLDAIAFLGALSGVDFYVKEYPTQTPDFLARMDAAPVRELADLQASAEANEIGLLWPWLALVYSGRPTDSIEEVVRLTEHLEAELRAPFEGSVYWDEKAWAWLVDNAAALERVFVAMRDAGFAQFRRDLIGTTLEDRAAQLRDQLSGFDVVDLQRRLSGKALDEHIDIVLLYFCLPHGVRIQGQRFIQSADFDLMTTVRIAAHELLHPPMDMDGPVATAALDVLQDDDLLTRIVRDHNPSFGYTTLEGMLNEDICQALDQLIAEQLSVAKNPADRWHASDDGMHVIAAGLYGMLREDGWVRRGGGSIEAWLEAATSAGRLRPANLHRVAARVLERPIERLWPLERETQTLT